VVEVEPTLDMALGGVDEPEDVEEDDADDEF
jgi:hypothetical protein